MVCVIHSFHMVEVLAWHKLYGFMIFYMIYFGGMDIWYEF
jgi:hypothetical protein